MNIVLIMAMREEAQPLIEALQLQAQDDLLAAALPMKCYSGQLQEHKVSLLLNGCDTRYQVDYIGTQAATLSAYTAIRDLQADVLISAGTAGGFAQRGADIGTVYLSDDRFVYHDRHVPLPGFAESSVGHYPAANVRAMAADLNMPYGIVSTGSSLEKQEKDIEVIEAMGAVAKEMEVAAIAWVAWLHKVPCFAIKSITNLLDRPGASEDVFVANLQCASEQLQRATVEILDYMQGKTLADLAAKTT